LRVAVVIVAVIVSAILVNPLSDSPIGDDPTYALSVKHLYETGHLRLPDEAAASVVFQVLWGYLFCRPFGFSFAALHLSTLVLSLGGLLGFYSLCRRLVEATPASPGGSGWLPVLVTLTLWFNPIYFTLSFTFYSDVPFYALVILSCAAFVAGQMEPRRDLVYFALGCFFSTCAVLVRQYAIVVPVAVAVLLGSRVWRVRSRAWAWIFLGIPLVALVGFYVWLWTYHGVPTQFRFAQLEMLKSFRIARDICQVPIIAVFYIGLFALPLTLALLGSDLIRSWRERTEAPSAQRCGKSIGNAAAVRLTLLAVIGASAVFLYATSGRLMPYLTDSPITPRWGEGVSLALTLASALSAAMMVEMIWRHSEQWVCGILRRQARRILGITGGVALIGVLLASGLFDAVLERLVDRALVAYYADYTSRVAANRPLDFWRGRVGEFYGGAKQIIFAVALGGIGLSLVARRIARRTRDWSARQAVAVAPEVALGIVVIFLFVGVFILISCRFDRYIFIVFPLALVAGYRGLASHRLSLPGVVMGLLVFALVSVASTKTMISGTMALFRAGEELLRRGAGLEQINLSYTFNVWMLYEHGHRTMERTGQPSYWVYASRPDFLYFAERPEAPARVVLEVPFMNYLQLRRDRVQVWMRVPAESPPPAVVK
jgi:hypothetical protein